MNNKNRMKNKICILVKIKSYYPYENVELLFIIFFE